VTARIYADCFSVSWEFASTGAPRELSTHPFPIQRRDNGKVRTTSCSLGTTYRSDRSPPGVKEGDQILKAAAQPIDRPGHHHVELPLGRVPAKCIEARPLVPPLGAADAVVAVDLDDLQAAALGSVLR
jgi:hypothetical protein